MTEQAYIRNFCIIAHIDHGKSTIADRLMEFTNAIEQRHARKQYLDSMAIEQERGITIKAQTVQLTYQALDGQKYYLNLIDTPGHVDFSYEVSRSLAACEGALLVVDASQGVEAQTITNVYMAINNNLEIIPVLNKIDLPAADPEKIAAEIENIIGLDTTDIIHASAKSGQGIPDLLEQVVKRIPPPQGNYQKPLKALIFDSWFDAYLGVVVLFRVMDGCIQMNSKILFMATGKEHYVNKLGKFTPYEKYVDRINAGEVGFLSASIKNINDIKIGDTITLIENPTTNPFPGYSEVKPMVFSGIYPVDTAQYEDLKDALSKLILNDSSLCYETETSTALGFGFRCGFLGLLHMEIVQERLEREFNLNLIITAPTVIYHVHQVDQKTLKIENPSQLPETTKISHIEEPYILGTIFVPDEYIGSIMQLCLGRRGIQKNMEYIGEKRVSLKYEFPLNEIVFDFYDQLKSLSKGYASFDYELIDYRKANLVKMDILLNGEIVDALSIIVHKDKAYARGRDLVKKMKEVIPRQMFAIAIQASIGAKIIARETISAMRKNVTAKCYGGDISRKRKLLEKQKAGKKRMKQLGSVEVPQEAFIAVLKLTE